MRKTKRQKTNINYLEQTSTVSTIMLLIILAKSGAIVSLAGVALMVIFVTTLLAFPVIKNCVTEDECSYRSTAPGVLQSVVQPSFLAISLISISAGILMIRLSSWLESKKADNDIKR